MKRIGIIPTAGEWLKFKELGNQYPKSVLPYKTKPLVIHNIESMFENDVDQIRIILKNEIDQDLVQKTVEKYYPNNKNIRYIQQNPKRKGLSVAIDNALYSHDDCEVLIILGDIIIENPEKFQHLLTENFVSIKKVEDYSRWCLIKFDIDEGLFKKKLKFFEKPHTEKESEYAVSGIYYFQNSKKLKKLLDEQLKNKEIEVYEFSEVLKEFKNLKATEEFEVIDFGSLEDYLKNRNVKKSRSFNNLNFKEFLIEKSSKKVSKIIAETNWFENLPDDIKVHTPRVLSKNFYISEPYYSLEKIFSPSLREIYLFLELNEEQWNSIFWKLFDVLERMKNYTSSENSGFMWKMFKKTEERVSQINIPIENILVQNFLKEFKTLVSDQELNSSESLIHWDYCYSNILYDMQLDIVKMIDPRWETFGSHYYDVAKLTHSALFDYDFVDAEIYSLVGEKFNLYNKGKGGIKNIFKSELSKRYSQKEQKYIHMITASLFLSMIPLHDHNKENQKIYYQIFKNVYEYAKQF